MVDKDEELNKDEAAAEDAETAEESSAPKDEEAAEAESSETEASDTEPVETDKTDKLEKAEESEASDKSEAVEEEEGGAATPVQLGYRRYVYSAYMAAAIAIAFLCTKLIDYGWFKLAQLKPEWFVTIGSEPKDEVVVLLSGAIGVGVAIYYWRHKKTRTLIEEIAEELTRVTWPSRQEVTNSTTTVIIATAFATIFFALMDQFWLWVTKHVYGS